MIVNKLKKMLKNAGDKDKYWNTFTMEWEA